MSATFDDAADRLLITTNIPGWSSGVFSQMAYFKINGTTGGLQTLFARIRDDVSAYIFIGLLSDLTFYYENSQGNNFSGPVLEADTWYNVAYSCLIGTGIEFFINGVSIGTAGASIIAGSPERLEMGGWRSINGNRLNGNICAELSWTRAIDAVEVTAQLGYAAPIDDTDIYNWTPMNTTDFGADDSGNGNVWTIGGALDLTANPPGVVFPSAGISVPVVLHHLQQQGFN